MEIHTRKISKEIYDRAMKNNGTIVFMDAMKLFEDYEATGCNVLSPLVFEKENEFYARYIVDKNF